MLNPKEIEERLEVIARNGREVGLTLSEIESEQETFRQMHTRNLLTSSWGLRESTMAAINYTLNTTYKNLQKRYQIEANDDATQNIVIEDLKKYCKDNHNMLALEAVTHYIQDPSNVWPLSLWWVAANDKTVELKKHSTRANRIKAIMLALENSVRGNNRNEDADQDDEGPNRPVCKYGFANQLAQCMKAGYDASHPDNVYEPDLPEAVRGWLPECLLELYAKSADKMQIRAAIDALSDPVSTQPVAPELIRLFENFTKEVARIGLEGFYKKYGHPESINEQKKIDEAFRGIIDNLHYVSLPNSEIMQETLEVLRAYGLTENSLKSFVISYESEVSAFKKQQQYTLIYLVTGKYPVPVRYAIPQLRPQECLIPEMAFTEMHGLCSNKLVSLSLLFKFGLRGEMLRTFAGPEDFGRAHQKALYYFMLMRKLPPKQAVFKINWKTEIQVSAWHLIDAIRHSNQEEVFKFRNCDNKVLEDSSYTPPCSKNMGWNALHYVAFGGNVSFIPFLLEAGINVNKQTNDGKTAVHIAVLAENAAIIPVLHDSGASVNIPDTDGIMPIHNAAHEGYASVIIALHAAGANVDAQLPDGRTPFHLAAQAGHAQAVVELRKAGADINILDNLGRKPIDIALKENPQMIAVAFATWDRADRDSHKRKFR